LTGAVAGGSGDDGSEDDSGDDENAGVDRSPGPDDTPEDTQAAANGPIVTPEGITIEQVPSPDPLDPQGLNQPITPEEQQRIANTLTQILNKDSAGLDPHAYRNLPHVVTGAVLPSNDAGYTVFDVPGSGAGRGTARLVFDNSGNAIYYTSNHYYSFYPITLNPR
jgi:hypothetical protein